MGAARSSRRSVADMRRKSPPVVAEVGLGLLLRQVEHRLEQLMVQELAELELSAERWRILSVLLDRPGRTMSELAADAVLPAASLTRHMDRLVEQGLVLRRIHSEDRRRVVAALSPLGARVAGRLREREQACEAQVSATLGRERYAALVEDLRLLPFALD